MRNKGRILLCFILIGVLVSANFSFVDAYRKPGEYFTVYNSNSDKVLFMTGIEVTRGDQYLSGDNKMYEVTRVNTSSRIAYADFINDVQLPKINLEALERVKLALDGPEGLAALFLAQEEEGEEGEGEGERPGGWENLERRVGIYTTHSAESYVPTDGEESIEEGGGIIQVASKLSEGFQNQGVEATHDETNHVPHDAGAYKRSRRTAMELMTEQGVASLIDVHRDAVPVEQYNTEINGKPASKVRMVIGRRNQNFKANEELAMHVKAVADEMHPGLIKDIFYAKGDYNQDLTPRAMLLEMGTFEQERQRPETSAGYFAEAVTTAMFGGVVEDEDGDTEDVAPEAESDGGSGAGIMGLIAVVGGGGLAFLFLSSGGKEWKSKLGNFKDEFRNFLGRSKNKK
ncbi:Stage II sporulation P family protein [Alkaliphilus metalliredigens QYMF]|uniref:Stage II sporulation P family protein n=1 Tax=Alkaliphilus metalliredigens (strain QYMF) TaxID=293826 RepID=A6TS45_ALKMQ|nr:stage II sporulation protein P [Alkaliphilus metalliredigens]ABR49013.1 Stage II sporulation P family protein [Alkaliphilus metalliredigens QYMF]